MNVQDVMVATPAFCCSDTNLGTAAEILWSRNCGILPIVDVQEQVVGVVTDRDLSIAMGTRNRLPGEITVAEVAGGQVYFCRPDDELSAALSNMAERKVRRLVVLNKAGKLVGILSMDDIVLHATAVNTGKGSDVSFADVIRTLKSIYGPQLPQVVRAASTGR